MVIPSTPFEKIDKLLLNLALEAGDSYNHEFFKNCDFDYPLAFAKDWKEYRYLLDAMYEEGYFSGNEFSLKQKVPVLYFSLTLKGWERIQDLRDGRFDSKQGFVACPFNDGHDKYRNAIEAGIKEAGFEPMSIKEKHYPETILAKALGEIRKSRFVVVDLTDQRSTVFVEMGFSMGLGMQPILVINASYWDEVEMDKERKTSLEFYSKNYAIKKYKDEAELKEIVVTAIGERIGFSNAGGVKDTNT